jgi:DNA helicase II / ATP-dependent DNA helicase PcrA
MSTWSHGHKRGLHPPRLGFNSAPLIRIAKPACNRRLSLVPCEERPIVGLLADQQAASRHRGRHARLLAGPGTGKTKTLVELVASLINDGDARHDEILCLTFTRAAAAGLRSKIGRRIVGDPPEVYTLHGYALKQLMTLRVDLGAGPGRVRVADDWEERWIVEEDLKVILEEGRVTAVRDRLRNLAAAWESTPEPNVEARHPDTQLIGALVQHKHHYQYFLRSELVYRLKEQFDANPYLTLTGRYKYVVVDEYQDLNRCDVAVIDAIAGAQEAHLFVAGDDDQSIYQQLRHAHPQAIRDFVASHDAADLRLVTCVRCDRRIIELARLVIDQEVARTPKNHEPHTSAGPGILEIVSFPNGNEEAKGVARIARKFMDAGVEPHEIMVLLRSDKYGRFSDPIEQELLARQVPAFVRTEAQTPLDENEGRALLAYLRLAVDRNDDLAWRTVFKTGHVGVGDEAVKAMHEYATAVGHSIADSIVEVAADPTLIDRFGDAIALAHIRVVGQVADVVAATPLDTATVAEVIDSAARQLPPSDKLTAAIGELKGLVTLWSPTSLSEFLSSLALRKEEEEALAPNSVNVMTAHRAKGLDACVVILAAAEEELFPGIGIVDEERRLFYVSITRAKHALFITHSERRDGVQRHAGTGVPVHHRTTFLNPSGIGSRRGNGWLDTYTPDPTLLSPITPAD